MNKAIVLSRAAYRCSALNIHGPGRLEGRDLIPLLFLLSYLLAQDGADRSLHLCWVLDIHRPDVWLSDINLSVRVLRGELQGGAEVRKNTENTQKSK